MTMSRRRESILYVLAEAPWWASLVFAGGAYVFVAYVAPAMLGARPLFAGLRDSLKTFAPWVALVFLLPIPFAASRRRRTRRLLNQQTGIDSIRTMTWRDFERVVGEAYRRQGYTVQETGGGGADGGIDLVLQKDGKHIVQCKHWKAYRVGVKEVRELLGLVTAEFAERGVLITTGRFTDEAQAFARGKPLRLVDGAQVLELVRLVQNVPAIAGISHDFGRTIADVPPAPPQCPKCGGRMVLRTAKRGSDAGSQFWGCSAFPNCRATIDAKSAGTSGARQR
jgi:restriction system protein